MRRAALRVLGRLRSAWEDQVELQERAALLGRPWEEDFTHWAFDGQEWRLHGHLPPPARGRARSTTGSGWCPGLRTPRPNGLLRHRPTPRTR